MSSAVAEGSPYLRAQNNLSTLKLDQMASMLPDYVKMTAEGETDLAGALAEMTAAEVAAREERITRLRIRSSGFPYVKTLADFDWSFQPSVPRPKVEELATLRFVDRAENVLLAGSPGVGRAHLAIAIGIEAVRAGREVKSIGCARLVDDLRDAQSRGTLKKRLRYYAHSKLLIVEELGYPDIDGGRGRPAVPAGEHPLRAEVGNRRQQRRHRRLDQGLRRRGRRQRHRRQAGAPLPLHKDDGQVVQAEGPAGGEEEGGIARSVEGTLVHMAHPRWCARCRHFGAIGRNYIDVNTG